MQEALEMLQKERVLKEDEVVKVKEERLADQMLLSKNNEKLTYQ